MPLRLIGAGLGRTGTASLKAALEVLLEAPCYHMLELFQHPEHVATWRAGAAGEPVDWDAALQDYAAAVDWPAAAFWRPLSDEHPDAVILLSTRDSSAAWWRSARETIFHNLADPTPPEMAEWRAMWDELTAATFTPDYLDEASAIAAYERHNADVRRTADPERLVEWRPGDGWDPLCAALGVPIPDQAFPHLNTTEEWVARRE